MLLALWAVATTRQRLIVHFRSEPFETRAAVEALTLSFGLPPFAFDYHEPALGVPLRKPAGYRHSWPFPSRRILLASCCSF